jgi:5-methyltetrahydrofolate--homocysteine methyltransferase
MSDYLKFVRMIQEGNFVETQNLVRKFLDQGKSAHEIIQKGIIEALDLVGKKFSAGELYIPEMLVAAKASQKGLEILKPLLIDTDFKPKGKVVIGTVKGDVHDIGKNIVSMMLEAAGFQVADLGIDVPPQRFIDAIKAEDAQILAMSCLLTTTMISMKNTMDAVRESGLYGKVKVMIGGPPITNDYALKIGADFRGKDAYEAVEGAKQFVSQ